MNDNFDLESIKELQQLAHLKDEDIDTSDIPEHIDWTAAKRGYFYRPQRQKVTISIDRKRTKIMTEHYTRWDSAECLETEEDIRLYLDACIAEDPGDGTL
ncbi:hypothetical protein [Chromatium okenii]|uniref:hypothetical protein n=1 Tax=Chromatium okenii TaxID=61644 RepID=UPI001F5BF8DF|nr:hypothetical protein [Chromatium okenii]